MRIVCLSDTHSLHDTIAVPDGDVLVHAGDLTLRGTEAETEIALAWLDALPHRTKLLVPGNHDFFFDDAAPEAFHGWRLRPHVAREVMTARFPSVRVLLDEPATIDGMTFYGSPWQPWFGGWAFNFERGDRTRPRATWARIPLATSVLITHGPPHGILDTLTSGAHVGDPDLRAMLPALTALRLHVFGHIHEAYGTHDEGGVRFVNASICTLAYRAENAPVAFDL